MARAKFLVIYFIVFYCVILQSVFYVLFYFLSIETRSVLVYVAYTM